MKNKTKALATAKSPVQVSVENLISQGIGSQAPVETMERLLAMRTQVRAEQAKEAFDNAMADFQAVCPIIKKTKIVKGKDGNERYRYAPLDSIILQVRKPLADNGLSYKVDAEVTPGKVKATVIAKHILGHSESSSFEVEVEKNEWKTGPQHTASALTFSKRYAFCDAFGIMTGDEDNDAATVATDDVNKGYAKLVSQVSKMGIASAKNFLKKVAGSPKYTVSQKKEFEGLIETRLKEIEDIKNAEKKC